MFELIPPPLRKYAESQENHGQASACARGGGGRYSKSSNNP